jgi:hypothetical protein
MRWINTLGIVPLAMVLAAVLARVSQLRSGQVRNSTRRPEALNR